MALIQMQKLKRNGWPEDEPLTTIEESLLAKTSGVEETEEYRLEWTEWRLDGLIVKRGVHVDIKRNPFEAGGVAAL